MKWLKFAASHAAIAGVLFLALAYVAGFGTRQSLVLALVLGWLTWDVAHTVPKPAATFVPYYVRVEPKWQKLLTDFKLISKPDRDWDWVQESLKEIPATEHPVLRTGFTFTVLQQSEDIRLNLIYWNDYREFVNKVDFYATMEPLHIEPRPPKPLFKSDVWLFMTWAGDCYNLGIQVPDSWWGRVKESYPKPLSERRRGDSGTVELVLATLPFEEFWAYWEPAQLTNRQLSLRLIELQPVREQYRSRFGWKKANFPTKWSETIEHTYFFVSHDSI